MEPREPWRAQAEIACMKSGIIRQSQWIRPSKPIEGPGPCGSEMPLKVAAFQNDTQASASFASMALPNFTQGAGALELTVLKPEATLTCPMVAWTDDWVAGVVQPASTAWFGQGVREIRTAGSYACRRRNHNPNARLSEHAFGNAIDVISFVLADGNVVTVKGGWGGTQQEQGFLREALYGACQRFRTVLGPGADALHRDHFHLDLARHDARGLRRYCKPKIEAPPRPESGAFGPAASQVFAPQAGVLARPGTFAPAPAASAGIAGERETPEIEGEFDPRAFDITASTSDLPRPRRRDAENQPLPAPSNRIQASPPAREGPALRPSFGGHLY